MAIIHVMWLLKVSKYRISLYANVIQIVVLDKLGEEIQELGSLVILLLLKSRRDLVGPSTQRRRGYISINYCCLVIHLKMSHYNKEWFIIYYQYMSWLDGSIAGNNPVVAIRLWLDIPLGSGWTHSYVWLLGWQQAKASLSFTGALMLEQDWLLYISVSQSRVPRGQVPRYKCLLNP